MSCDKDTIILTPEGLFKIIDMVKDYECQNQTDIDSFYIEDCDYGNRIATVIGITNNLRHDKFSISDKFDTDNNNVIDVTTSFGFNVCGTYDHQIVVINKKGNLKYKKLCDISQEDYIAICYNTNFFNDQLKLKYNNRHKRNNSNYQELKNFQYMNGSIARLLGYIISEGNAIFEGDTAYRIMITTYDKEMQDDIINICKNLGIDAYCKYSDGKNDGSPIGVIINSIIFTGFIYYLGYKHLARNKEIPWSILQADKDSQVSFIRALFDGDGTVYLGNIIVVEYYSSSYELCRQLQIMLLNMGIVGSLGIHKGATLELDDRTKTYENSYRLTLHGENIIKFADIISFGLKRKKNILDNCTSILKDRDRSTNITYPYLGNKINILNEKLKRKGNIIKKWQEDFDIGNKTIRITRQKNMTHNMYLEEIGLRRNIPRIIAGDRSPTKNMLDRVLDALEPDKNEKEYPLYLYMKNISNIFMFDKVEKIEKKISGTYSIKTYSYIGNGMINR